MSYDLHFDCGPIAAHNISGGTYAEGGTSEPWFNITYNYAEHYYRLWPDAGIRSLYGMTARQVVAELDSRIPELVGKPDPDYWSSTEGNAKVALLGLRALAASCPPDAVLNGD